VKAPRPPVGDRAVGEPARAGGIAARTASGWRGGRMMAVQREQVVQAAEKLVARGKIEAAIREYRKVLS
jgi:hypothetical protein